MKISPIALQKIDALLTPRAKTISPAANDHTLLSPIAANVTHQVVEDIRSALTFWCADDYEDWIRTANALHSLGDVGFELWSTWAKQSAKFDEQEAGIKWRQCPGERTGIGAIFAEAKRRGWVNINHKQATLSAQLLPQVTVTKRPLPSALLPVDCLDLDILPASIRPFIADTSYRMSCQPDFIAVATLCNLAGIIGRKATIAPKAKDDWSVIPNLWGAIVGRPSAMKSPAISAAIRPIVALENLWQSQYEHDLREQRVREAFASANTKDRKKRMADAAKIGDIKGGLAILAEEELEDIPPAKRAIVNDATIEKLGELMNENPNGLLLVRDELSGLIGALMREDAITDRAFLLECYDGKNPFTFDRIGRGTVRINSPLLSILGGIQPSRLSALVRETNNGTGDDGLLQRFQVMVWPDDTSDWKYIDVAPNATAYSQYANLISDLSKLPDHDANSDEPAKPWRFSEAAQPLFIEWYSNIMLQARIGEHNSAFESHLIKSPKTCASLALIFELTDGNTTSGIVGETATKNAISMMGYLLSHAARIYAYGNGSIVGAAETILHHAARIEQPFTMRDIARKGWSGINTENIQGALELLIDYGHVTATATAPSATGGRPTSFFNFVGDIS
jgi:hypothetical protein